MKKRFIIIALIFGVAFLLPGLNNKVMTGSQELYATIQKVKDSEKTYEILLKDLAGNVVEAEEAEKENLIKKLATTQRKNGKGFDLTDSGVEIKDGTLVFTLKGDDEYIRLRGKVMASPFLRDNPSKDWWNIALGIDLRGGVEFNCALYNDNGAKVPATEEVVATLRDRLDARGLSEPQVYRLSTGDVQIVIPGGTRADAARTRKVLQTTGKLEFREVIETYGGEDPQKSSEPGNKITKDASGRWIFNPKYNPAPNERRPRFTSRNEVLMPGKPARGESPSIFYRLARAKVTGEDVVDAYKTMQEGQIAVGIKFSVVGGAKNYDFTKSTKDNGPSAGGQGTGRIAISLDGFVESAPNVISPSQRSCVISGSFSEDEVRNLRTVLKAGSLSVKPEITSQKVVGPTLGQDTIDSGINAMIDALLIVLIFIILYYWWRFGVVAVIGLVSCLALIIVAVSAFGATMTLPGIAGLVLTVGMAVDANILIFERIREETKLDIDIKSCVNAGYGRAFVTILDANLTTFLTALALYVVGSGPIKGFGLILMVGIITSMFGAIYIGRFVTDYLYSKTRKLHVANRISIPEISFMKFRKLAFTASAIFIIASLAWFGYGKGSYQRNFDIDFTGGNMVQVTFKKGLSITEVQDKILTTYNSDKEKYNLINPENMQLMPYYASFEENSDKAMQFVIKVRDEKASEIEKQKVAIEKEQVKLQKEWNAKAKDENGKDITPPKEEREKFEAAREALIAKAAPFKKDLVERVETLKGTLAIALEGSISEEGSEMLAANFKDNKLSMSFATIATPNNQALIQLKHELETQVDITSVETKSLIETKGFEVTIDIKSGISYADKKWKPESVLTKRLQTLLEANKTELSKEALIDLVHRGKSLITDIDSLCATAGLQIATPYPASDYFSPQVAEQMKIRALWAILASMFVILLYIAMRFELRFAFGAIGALVHDVLATVGLMSILGLRIDLTVVAALLTIVGYSLNDTIVVFDRIRENSKKQKRPIKEVLDVSIRQTMSRTILTSLTTIFVVGMLFFFGGDGVRTFSAVMLIGLFFGTYSSVFIASPILLLFKEPAEKNDDDPEQADDKINPGQLTY